MSILSPVGVILGKIEKMQVFSRQKNRIDQSPGDRKQGIFGDY